ncbi:hypothetical protein HYPSUDRAFT_43757 [Hypholoma sublateritium FD-334 SS-4]|uniref:Tyrosine--tRNA ligase n=1 Tax=Hypholoma sublateritium (strain FD-334 SS-4) TaxID=945553 RepID=A0A0D2PIP0_HYPSF|nr:hypothetical protein HYPSUDRAFT_43757 [Hypholoma sublateritium FD-334 SS-4]
MWVRRCILRKVLLQRQFHAATAVVPLLEDLQRRGFVQDITRHDSVLGNALESKKQTIYAGVDPTAKSLHIGHLIPMLVLLHFQIHGHRVMPLIGGATGRLGDPSGRLVERQLADIKQVDNNADNLTASIQSFFNRALVYASSRLSLDQDIHARLSVVNNLEWHQPVTLLEFLHKVGAHVRINTMLNRESVSARLSSQQGLSFTEFTYQLLQAYDFYHLNKHFGCTIQVGGSDQWGNIVAGLELIGKLGDPLTSKRPLANEAFGITTPLLTTSSGEKFGKSAGNAVWLNPTLTSVFDFYQYFLKVTDADVGKYLRLLTLMPLEEIEELVTKHNAQPEKRLAQSRLAAEVTEMVHTKTGVAQAVARTKLLFGSDYTSLKVEDVIMAFQDDPRLVKATLHDITKTPLSKLAAKYGLVSSNSASRTLISSRGLYLNDKTVKTAQDVIELCDLQDQKIAILRAGKGKILILVVSD